MGGHSDDYSSHSEVHIEITVKSSELLGRLKKNKEKHKTVYDLALKKWQEELEKTLLGFDPGACQYWPEDLTRLEKSRPVSHLDEYDRAIDMFTMCIKEEIKINAGLFRKLCRDEWDWKSSVLSNKYYLEAIHTLG